MVWLQPFLDGVAGAARRAEAYCVHGALLDAASASLYERMVAAATLGLPRAALPPLPPRKHAGSEAEANGSEDVVMADAETEEEAEAAQAGRGGQRRRSGDRGKGGAAAGRGRGDAVGSTRRRGGGLGAAGDDDDDGVHLGANGGGAKASRGHARAHAASPDDDGSTDSSQLVATILADSWREDADFSHVLWALQQLFGEELLARMPLAHPPSLSL